VDQVLIPISTIQKFPALNDFQKNFAKKFADLKKKILGILKKNIGLMKISLKNSLFCYSRQNVTLGKCY